MPAVPARRHTIMAHTTVRAALTHYTKIHTKIHTKIDTERFGPS